MGQRGGRVRPLRESWWLLVACLCLAAYSPDASAQDANIQQFRPSHGTLSNLAVDSTDVLTHLQFGFGVHVHASKNLLIVRDAAGNRLGALIDQVFAVDTSLAFGILDFMDIGVVVPTTPLRTGDSIQGYSGTLSSSAMGDLRIGTRLRLVGRPGSIFRLAFRLDLDIPMGAGDGYAYSPQVSLNPVILSDVRFFGVRMSFNLGFRNLFGGSTDILGTVIGREMTWGASVGYDVFENLTLLADVWGAMSLVTASDAPDGRSRVGSVAESPLEWMAGIRYVMPVGLAAKIGGGTGITRGYGNPDWRVMVFLGWNFEPIRGDTGRVQYISDAAGAASGGEGNEFADRVAVDEDGDGIPETRDLCPRQPEDIDQFEDQDGCPDPDNDGDGVPDTRLVDGPNGTKEVRVADRCPLQREDHDGIDDDDGCPESDADGDGVDDGRDACPEVAEDLDGFADADGCPDYDNDADGFLDTHDGPVGADGFGICRNAPEAYETKDIDAKSPDGCPDAVQLVAPCRLKPLKIRFATNSARISRTSFGALTAYARALQMPNWLKAVRIEGHSDDRGDDAMNQELSQRRAQAVVDWMVKRGVPAERMKAMGYGESIVPTLAACSESETSDACRTARRRVEFVIVDTEYGRCTE